jgi:hypothetical protein
VLDKSTQELANVAVAILGIRVMQMVPAELSNVALATVLVDRFAFKMSVMTVHLVV